MAVAHGDVESWLPTEFLTEEELLMDKENFNNNGSNTEFKPSLSFPTEFPYEFDPFGSSTAFSSPVGSVVGSTETESSEEDDYIAGLTRRLTQQLAVNPEKWVIAGSPESTLSGIGSWPVSSSGSPKGVLSPPTTPFGAKNDTWDLIYEAAGQVARLKMSNEDNNYSNYQGRGLLGSTRTQNQVSVVKNQNTGFYPSQSFAHNVPQMSQYQQHVRQGQVLKPQYSSVWDRQQVKAGWQAQSFIQPPHQQQPQQQILSRERSVGYENARHVRPLGLPQSVWPPRQVQQPNQHQHQHHHPQPPQHSSSGMRSAFLGGSGVKRECAGTGVFLPRRYGIPPDSKKKSAGSAVVLPAKVVQALNLNFDDGNMNAYAQPHFNSTFASDYEALVARRNALFALQKRNLRPEGVLNHEIRLPQEWTY